MLRGHALWAVRFFMVGSIVNKWQPVSRVALAAVIRRLQKF